MAESHQLTSTTLYQHKNHQHQLLESVPAAPRARVL